MPASERKFKKPVEKVHTSLESCFFSFEIRTSSNIRSDVATCVSLSSHTHNFNVSTNLVYMRAVLITPRVPPAQGDIVFILLERPIFYAHIILDSR